MPFSSSKTKAHGIRNAGITLSAEHDECAFFCMACEGQCKRHVSSRRTHDRLHKQEADLQWDYRKNSWISCQLEISHHLLPISP